MRISRDNVIRSKAPLRLGLAGGGTDLSPYCDTYGGAVLNATIGRYALVSLSFSSEEQVEFVSHDFHRPRSVAPNELLTCGTFGSEVALAAEVYRRISRDYLGEKVLPLRIETSIDAPPGSGLGSSSALVVALVEAFVFAFDLPLGQYEVGRLAWEIERVDLNLAGGKQDQYAAAFGGINFIEFLPNDRVIVNPLRLSSSAMLELETSLLIAYTGISRQSESIIRDQVQLAGEPESGALDSLHRLKADAHDLKAALLKWDVAGMAGVLNRSWLHKKQTSSRVSSVKIDEIYDMAMKAGALGGKISGAGGGGFMMLFVDPAQRSNIRSALREAGADADFVTLHEHGAQAWQSPRYNLGDTTA